MSMFENLSSSQKIRAALHRDVRSICTETCHFLGLEMAQPAMDVVAELVFKKMSVYGSDLEAFAKHAKRSTINTDDVKLLARRNPSLKGHINSLCSSNPSSSKDKRRKTLSKAEAKESEKTASRTTDPLPETNLIKNVTEKKEPAKQNDETLEDMAIDDVVDLTFD